MKCTYALVCPSIALSTSRKLKLRVLKQSEHIYVGVGLKQAMTKSNFKYPGNGYGLYISGSSGWIYNVKDRNQHVKKSDLVFLEGDLI